MRNSLPLESLWAFHVVADTGSLTAAAARLGVTQPAVSRRLRELEADLGVALVRRGANALAPHRRGWPVCGGDWRKASSASAGPSRR